MANRTGTYVAFDGLGQDDPTKSDFRYYATIQAWDAHKKIDFQFTNSHEKTYAVRDTSTTATLKARIQDRLRASKNMVVVLTSATRKTGSMLVFEIEQAVDQYKLPLNTLISPSDLSLGKKCSRLMAEATRRRSRRFSGQVVFRS